MTIDEMLAKAEEAILKAVGDEKDFAFYTLAVGNTNNDVAFVEESIRYETST